MRKTWNDTLAGRFVFEFIVVVAGVLVALGLNAWLLDWQERESEAHYLSLLGSDVDRAIVDLEVLTDFEEKQTRDAKLAIRALARSRFSGDQDKVSEALAHLVTRQTMILKNSTYQDLVGTGRLNLIRESELRDAIVEFYEVTPQRFEVINRNNSFFVDSVYNTKVIFSGLIQPRLSSNNPVGARAVARMAEEFGQEPLSFQDRLWSLPADATEWSVVHSALMGRMFASVIAQQVGAERLQAARELKAAIAAF